MCLQRGTLILPGPSPFILNILISQGRTSWTFTGKSQDSSREHITQSSVSTQSLAAHAIFHMIWSHAVTCKLLLKSVISWRSWLWGRTIPDIRTGWCSGPRLWRSHCMCRLPDSQMNPISSTAHRAKACPDPSGQAMPVKMLGSGCTLQVTTHKTLGWKGWPWTVNKISWSHDWLGFYFMQTQAHELAWSLSLTLQLWVSNGNSSVLLKNGEYVVAEITRTN